MLTQSSAVVTENAFEKQHKATVQAIQGLLDVFRTELSRLDNSFCRLETIEAEFEKRTLHVPEAVFTESSQSKSTFELACNELESSGNHSLPSVKTHRRVNVKEATVPSTPLLAAPKSKIRRTLEAEINDLPEFPWFNDSKQPSINLFPRWTTGLPEDFHLFMFHVNCHLLVYRDVYHQKEAIRQLVLQIPLEYYRIRCEFRKGIGNYTVKRALLALMAQVPDVEDANSYQLDADCATVEDDICN